MPCRILTIINQRGLHARASVKFVNLASQFVAKTTVSKDGETVAATSIMGLMMLAANAGTKIKVCAEGEQAEAALEALSALVDAKFDEI